ncbi:hypothetical protein MTO96_011713 [Rhipicephalus appendiculatus]
MLASSALFGVSNGWRITLLAPSVTKDFGVDRMPLVLGGVTFWSGVVVITGPFLVEEASQPGTEFLPTSGLMALSMASLRNDPSFGLDSRRSWMTAVFLCLCLTTMLIGQHAVGVLFYGIVRTYGVSREDASWPLVLSHSLALLAGSATAGVHVAVSVLASQHFEKRRATACSVIYTLTGINSLYLPPLAELLRVTYGIHGTFLVLGGMIMNALPPVLAVRSPEWAKPWRQSRGNTITNPDMDMAALQNSLLLPASGTQDSNDSDNTEISHEKTHETEVTEVPLVQNVSSRLNALRSVASKCRSAGKNNAEDRSFTTTFRVLTSKQYVVNAISFSLVALGSSTFRLLSVDIAVDKGITSSSAVFLLNAFAVADMVTRPLSGIIIDSRVLTLESVMLLGYVLQLLSLELFVWLDSLPLMLASSALFGVSSGSRITLLPPLVSKEFGVDRMPVLLGGVNFWTGIVILTAPFLVGK